MNNTFKNIDEYISHYTPDVRKLLTDMRDMVCSAAPEAEECISYGMPAYRSHGMLVYFAAYERHIGFYPGAGGIAQFKDELDEFKHGKGSIQFPLNKPLPSKLITKIVKFRARQNKEKHTEKIRYRTSRHIQ